MTPFEKTSPRSLARFAGAAQLLEAITATSGQKLVLGKLVVSSNAAVTAGNILAHEQLFWVGFGSSIIGVMLHVLWGFLMYELMKPVSRRVSTLTAFVILVGCAMQLVTSLLYIAPLGVLQNGNALSALSNEQLQTFALVLLRLNAYAFDIYLVFFGLWCLLIGYLVFRSTFLPRLLGILVAVSGLGWILFLYPPLAHYLFVPYIAGASAIGEIPLEFWLLIFAVNVQRWKEQAERSA